MTKAKALFIVFTLVVSMYVEDLYNKATEVPEIPETVVEMTVDTTDPQ